MKTFLLQISMMLLLASCQKTVTNTQKSVTEDDIVLIDSANSEVETIQDTTYPYDNAENQDYLFDSCTNEYVHIWGNIHWRVVHWHTDSVKQSVAGDIDYQNLHAVGNTSGQTYTFRKNIKWIQNDEWNGQWFENHVNYYHAHSALFLKGDAGAQFINDTYYYFVTGEDGSLIISKEHYDLGSCH